MDTASLDKRMLRIADTAVRLICFLNEVAGMRQWRIADCYDQMHMNDDRRNAVIARRTEPGNWQHPGQTSCRSISVDGVLPEGDTVFLQMRVRKARVVHAGVRRRKIQKPQSSDC